MKRAFQLIYTSDIHGKLFPLDYGTGKKKDCGLLSMASRIKRDGNTLVLDGGDNLQGSPLLQYFLEHRKDFSFHPLAEAFGAMGLQYFTIGNHDFNFGYEVLRDYLQSMRARCLCANLSDLRGELPLRRIAVHRLENGLTIGLCGIVTDYVNVWESPEHLSGLKITDALTAAKRCYEELRGKCDISICIYHGGYEEELSSGRKLTDSRENIACEIARECGFDILLTGHQHVAVEGRRLFRSFTAQPPANAERYLLFEGELETGRGERHLSLSGKLLPSGNVPSEATAKKLSALEERTERWLEQPIGRLSVRLGPEEKLKTARYGSRIAALINAVQLAESGADFSCTGLSNEEAFLGPEISIRDIYRIYPFSNSMVVKEVDRKSLKEALERCASYFTLDEEGQPAISGEFLEPKIEHYNYDFYAGLDYAFDLRRPIGERVAWLRRLSGEELSEDRSYRLVMSNYRASGTGGYGMLAACRTLSESQDNTQDLLIAAIRRREELSPPDNFRFRLLF